jgi:hypothetical protein
VAERRGWLPPVTGVWPLPKGPLPSLSGRREPRTTTAPASAERTHARPVPARRYYVQLGSGMSEAALCAAACAALGARGFSVVDVNTGWLPGVARLGRSLSERQMLLATLNHPLLPPVGPALSRVPAPAWGRHGGAGAAPWGGGGGLGVAGAGVGPNTCTQLTARPHARAAGAKSRGPVGGQDARADPAAEGRHDVGEGRHVDAVGWEARGHEDHLRPTRRARCPARRHTCLPLVGVNLGRTRLYKVPGGARLAGSERDLHERPVRTALLLLLLYLNERKVSF